MMTLRYSSVIGLEFPVRAASPKSRPYYAGPSVLRRAVQFGRDILLALWAIGALAFLLAILGAAV